MALKLFSQDRNQADQNNQNMLNKALDLMKWDQDNKLSKNQLQTDQNKNIMALRKEFQGNPIYKDTLVIESQGNKLENAWVDYLNKPADASRLALDQALITIYNKMLDPTSVVRESEYARTAHGQSVINKLQGFQEKIATGGAGLTDPERQEIINLTRVLRKAQREMYGKITGEYTNEAGHYNTDPERVIGEPLKELEFNSISSIEKKLGRPLTPQEIEIAKKKGYQ